MPKLTKKITIDSSIETIWETLSDFDEISHWARNVSHSCLLSDLKQDVGTIRRIQQGSNVLTEVVTVWESPLLLAYEINGLPPIFESVTNTWTLTPHNDGTEIRLEVEILPKRRPVTPFAAFACILVSRFNYRMLRDLKNFQEKQKPYDDLREEVSILTSRLVQLESGSETL